MTYGLDTGIKHNSKTDPFLFTPTFKLTCKCCMNLANIKTADGRANQAIGAGGEGGEELRLVLGQLVNRLNLIEVEGEFTGNAAIDSRLQISRPILAEDVLAAGILFADTCNARVDRLSAIDVFNSCLTEEEVHIVTNVEGSHKVWF